jgi:phenylalanyl-tRNA synthetase beta chain
MTTLDGQERALGPDDLVIADADKPVAIAGIMGGEDSEVRSETTNLLLEAANFDPLTVLRTSRRLRLRTESSTRWEKGVDPYAAEQAAVYATQLFVELAGARWVGHVDVNEGLPERPRVRLDVELTRRLTGMDIPPAEHVARLESLGFEVDDDMVTVPTWRARDVTRPVDLVEEVARFHMEEVGATLPLKRTAGVRLTREQRLRRTVEDVLVGAGFYEAYTWTFVPAGEGRIALEEPQSSELAALRTDLSHWLIESAERNRNVGVDRIALFELARVFLPSGDQLPHEPWHVAGICDDYARAKGAVETLYRALHVDPGFEAAGAREARTPEGSVREVAGGWGYFELDLDALFVRVPEYPAYEDVITYPAVKQDLAFVVDEAVTAAELVAAAREAAGPELRELRPFDVYRGDQVGPGKKSIALAAAFQSPERTLSDAEAAEVRQRIVEALARRFGAVLRA